MRNNDYAHQVALGPEAIETAALMLKCIGHPLRLQIIALLDLRGELNVTAIYEALGIEQAVASQHLSLMRDKGVLAGRRDGVNVYYRILDPRVPRVIDCIRRSGL
jgi:DNA-binding transcriptional ArsR family regulator